MIQEIQRLKGLGFGRKAIARALRISRNTVKQYWGGDAGEDRAPTVYQAPWSEGVDWEAVRKSVEKGQALAHHWEAVQEALPQADPRKGVPYVSFWREYRRRFPEVPLVLGQMYPPGANCEIDYKGSRPNFGFVDPALGKFVLCELFGAVLGFSRYLSVDASRTQQKADFLRSVETAYRDFEGVPKVSVTDNLTPAVTKAGKRDADLNPDYASFCAHYNTVAMPARPRKPKDKNQIESELGLFWRWLRPSLVGQTFHSLSELREYTRKAAERYNARVQRRTGQSRAQRREEEKPHLLPLPPAPYEICEWRTARPHPDCHIQVRKNFYSVPYALRGKHVEVRITATTVEIFFRGERVATHRLRASNEQGRYATNPGHYPEAQKTLLETVPGALLRKASDIGPLTERLVKDLFALGNHPLRYLRRVQGVLALLRDVTAEELEDVIATFRRLGEPLPKPSMLLDAVRQSRALREEAPPIARRENRFLRGTRPVAPADTKTSRESACNPTTPVIQTQGDCSWP